MKRKTRLLLLGAAIVLPLGLGLWARSAASWRPQKLGTFSSSVLMSDSIHGPWIYGNTRTLNLETRRRISLGTLIGMPHFSPDSHSFAILSISSNQRWEIVLRDCTSSRILRRFPCSGHQDNSNFEFSPNGTHLLIPMGHGIEIVPLNGSKKSFAPLPSNLTFVCLSNDGKWVCLEQAEKTGESHRLKVFDVTTGKLRQTIPQIRSTVFGCQFSPDASMLYINDGDSSNETTKTSTWFCDLKSGHKLWGLSSLKGVVFSPDSHTALTFSPSTSPDHPPHPNLELRSARTGKILSTSLLPHPVEQADFSKDGSSIYVLDNQYTLWKVRVR